MANERDAMAIEKYGVRFDSLSMIKQRVVNETIKSRKRSKPDPEKALMKALIGEQ